VTFLMMQTVQQLLRVNAASRLTHVAWLKCALSNWLDVMLHA